MNSAATRPLAVVTGASSGIGYELATQFAQHGFDLLIAAEHDGIAAAAQALQSKGANVEHMHVDLATYKGMEKLCARIAAAGRPVDALALNAGVGFGGDFTRHTDLKAELNLIALNVVAPVHLAKRLVKDMVARGKGRVLFTSSVVATMPTPFEAVYGASKAFVHSFAEALRKELKDTGVTVTVLMPGPTETNFFHRTGMDDTKVGAGKKDDPSEVARRGFEALMAGEDHVVASSAKSTLQGAIDEILSAPVKAEMHRTLVEAGSAKQ